MFHDIIYKIISSARMLSFVDGNMGTVGIDTIDRIIHRLLSDSSAQIWRQNRVAHQQIQIPKEDISLKSYEFTKGYCYLGTIKTAANSFRYVNK